MRVVISAFSSGPQGGSESLNGWSTAEGIAQVFTFTSVREAFEAQMLEASAKGLPTVAVRQSGIGASLPIVAGKLVEPLPGHDLPERLAGAVVQMLDQPPPEWMAQNSASYQSATLNTWSAHCRRLSDLYQEVA